MDIVLSKSTWPIIGWVCQILGWLINGIYFCLEKIGIPNIGIAIILYTIIHLSRSDAASDQAAEDVEDDERNAAGSAEN